MFNYPIKGLSSALRVPGQAKTNTHQRGSFIHNGTWPFQRTPNEHEFSHEDQNLIV